MNTHEYTGWIALQFWLLTQSEGCAVINMDERDSGWRKGMNSNIRMQERKKRSWLKALKRGLGWKTGERMGVEGNLDSMQTFAEETNTVKRVLRSGRVDEKQLRGWIDRLLYTAHCKGAFICTLTSTRLSPLPPGIECPRWRRANPVLLRLAPGWLRHKGAYRMLWWKEVKPQTPPPVTTKTVNEDDFLSL